MCAMVDIFMKLKMECSIQRSEAKFNRTSHILPIVQMKNIRYSLYNIKYLNLSFTMHN